MTLKKITTVLCLLSYFSCFSSDSIVDQQKLINTFNQFYNKASEIIWSDINDVDSYIDSCHALAGMIESDFYLGKCYSLKARTIVYNDLDSAIFYEEKAVSIFSAYPDSLHLFTEYYNLGNMYLMGNNFVKALSYFERVIVTIDENYQSLSKLYPKKIQLSQAYNYSSLALAKSNVHDYEGTLESYMISQNIIEDIDLKEADRLKAINIGNMANAFLELGEYDKARDYANNSIVLRKQYDMTSSLAFSYLTLGRVEHGLKNYTKALDYLNKAKKGFVESNNSKNAYETDLFRVKCFIDQKQFALAEKHLIILKDDTISSVSPLVKYEMLKVYAKLYKEQGQLVEANELLLESLKHQEAILFNRSKNAIIDFISFYENQRSHFDHKFKTYQFEEERKKMALVMKNETQKKKLIYSALGIVMFFLCLVIFLVYRAYSRKNKMNAELLKLVSQKQVLLQEVHHRVKNNFQITSSLLSLQERQESGDKAKTVLSGLKGRIKSMSLVHEMLYQKDNIEAIEFSGYVKELISSINDSYGLSTENVNIEVKSNPIFFKLDKAIPMALILNESITNALKYAFKPSEKGKINITVTELNDGYCMVSIKDNGVGIPEEILTDTSEKIGLDLIKILGDQIDGEVNIRNNDGAEISVVFEIKSR